MEVTKEQKTALAEIRSILISNNLSLEDCMIYMDSQKVEVNEVKLNNLLENYDCGFCPIYDNPVKSCDQENCLRNLRAYLDIEE
nr:MAG TPA: hypothetical protein [Caudoviricetes sp.]